jgi:hypothetical protein
MAENHAFCVTRPDNVASGDRIGDIARARAKNFLTMMRARNAGLDTRA